MKQQSISRKLFDLFRLSKWDSGRHKQLKLMKKIGRFRMRCDLCGRVYRATSLFFRSCRTCRHEYETVRQARV